MDSVMQILKNKRYVALAAVLFLVLGVITPYYTFSFLGVTYNFPLVKYWEGYVVLFLTLANVLFIFKDYVEKYVPQLYNSGVGIKIKNADSKFAILPAIGIVLIVIIFTVRYDAGGSIVKHGFGFYSLWIGAILIAVHSFLYKPQAAGTVNNMAGTIPQQPMMQQPVMNQSNMMNQQPMMQQPQPMQQPMMDQNNMMNQQPMNQPQPMMNQDSMMAQQPMPQEPQMMSNTKVCPNCGNACDANAMYCPNCGNQLL